MKTVKFFVGCICVFALTACAAATTPVATPIPAPEVPLPTLPGYQSRQPSELQTWIDDLPTIVIGDPRIDVTVAVMRFANGVTKCYQEQGAAQVGFYTKETDLLTAGLVTIVDHNRVTDINVLMACATDRLRTESEMCFVNQTLERESNKFYISYIGTNAEMCGQFSAWYDGLQ